MSYAQELREHARIAILRLLEDAPRYTSNVSMMTDLLRRFGIGYTRDQVTAEVHWLQEQGLLVAEDHNGFVIATATLRGVEVAQGIVTHPGIQRPRPRV
ncbi:VpaChn25_0724 family phage protein [Salipiger marinus]|uniref:VpaChn25_0724 family phage protein n=1 Tax=Salipiger marinus TaxID=555512 RepID=UPI0040591453